MPAPGETKTPREILRQRADSAFLPLVGKPRRRTGDPMAGELLRSRHSKAFDVATALDDELAASGFRLRPLTGLNSRLGQQLARRLETLARPHNKKRRGDDT